MTRFFTTALMAAATLTLAACGGADVGETSTDKATVYEVTDAYIMAPLGGRDVTGGGLKVSLSGPSAKLVAAESTAADTVEIHTMRMEDGTMKMRKVDSLDVSEAQPLSLEQGGDHLMLFGLEPSLAAGDVVDLLLTFENAEGKTETVYAETEVRGR